MKTDHQRRNRHRGSNRTRIDIVPLIDVIFLLLCFFVLITIQMVMQKGMPVNLAEATEGQSTKEQKAAVVSVRQSGTIYFNKEKVSPEKLETTVSRWKKQYPDRRLMLNVDRSVTHGTVIDVTDRLRSAGVHDIVFTVEPSS